MNFRVEPYALRTYAAQLGDDQQVAQIAKSYANRYGSFSFHEKGLIGLAAPGHRTLLKRLNDLLQHLSDLADSSAEALKQAADGYARSDLRTASALDATYPAIRRTSLKPPY
ncbi:hypothetical protein GCM10023322_52730 [Rugosimonospora acidiphila]|uniref:Excreted virulence factor EspC, type VII ESX diderm n=1 Tax=Rugosimonospora acidiphila TaxID=556531 RepID=A0ABP9SB47_9ACTN